MDFLLFEMKDMYQRIKTHYVSEKWIVRKYFNFAFKGGDNIFGLVNGVAASANENTQNVFAAKMR